MNYRIAFLLLFLVPASLGAQCTFQQRASGNCSQPATATASPASGTAPLVIAFTAAAPSTEAAMNWAFDHWDFGDGSPISVVLQTTHTYAAPGQYTATVFFAGGEVDATATALVTVTGSAITSLTLTPTTAAMMVGDDSKTLALTDQNGNRVTGATWSVDNIAALSLSTDDPPKLAALNPGTATVTASMNGLNAQTLITVYPYGSGHHFPVGTVLWTSPSASGFPYAQMLTATPGSGAAFIGWEADGNGHQMLRGLSSDGQSLWQSAQQNVLGVIPGNNDDVLVLRTPTIYSTPIVMTAIAGGQPAWSYTANALSPNPAVRSDGVIFTVQTNSSSVASLVGLSEATGLVVFQYQLPQYSASVGPVMAAPDGSVYVESVSYTATVTGNLTTVNYSLNLVRVDSSNNASLQLLHAGSYQRIGNGNAIGDFAYPAEVIPDGNGGVLVGWDLWASSGTTGAQLYQVNSAGGITPFAALFSNAAETGWCGGVGECLTRDAGGANSMVLGENNTAFASNRFQITAFDVTSGSQPWTYTMPSGHFVNLVAALWGGGVAVNDDDGANQAAARFDATGNLTYDGWNSNSFTPNYVWPILGTWAGVSGSSYQETSQSTIVPAQSVWGFPGGNPAGSRSHVAEIVEDMPTWGATASTDVNPGVIMLPSAINCRIPQQVHGIAYPAKVPITDPASKDLAARIKKVKDKLLLSGTMGSTACFNFFTDPRYPIRNLYYFAGLPTQLVNAVTNQVQWNGTLSTISHWDAGIWGNGLQDYPDLVLDKKQRIVACDFATEPALVQGQIIQIPAGAIAESQVQAPSTDVYYTANPQMLNQITPGTILHEALHNLTGRSDSEMRDLLGMQATNSDISVDITVQLEKQGCAPKP